MALEIAILGPVEVRLDGDLLRVPPGKQRALLTLLAVHAPEPVAAEVAADSLWPRTAPSESLRSLQVTVSRLRRSLGSAGAALETTASGYRLALDADAIDARRFETLLHGVAERSTLEAALALWRGRALADVEYESFAQGEIARLEELRLLAQEQLIDVRLSQGEHALVIAELELLAAAHPSREQLIRMLMLALYRSGRQAEALDVYQHSRRRLDEELGLEPTPALQRLQAQILRQDPALEALAPTLDMATLSLGQTVDGPRSVRRAEGEPRYREARGCRCHPRRRSGEARNSPGWRRWRPTRMSSSSASSGRRASARRAWRSSLLRALADGVADGAYFVSLAALTSADDVPSTIARAFGVAEVAGGRSDDAVVAHCATRAMLLVLDNFEHVIDAALFVSDLLAAAPRLTVIVTSREPLHIRAEHVFTLAPLAVPSVTATQEVIPRRRAGAGALFGRREGAPARLPTRGHRRARGVRHLPAP